jgi:hypothetical protein
MCWPWNHKWKEVDREAYRSSAFWQHESTDGYLFTIITFQCEKCHHYKQIELNGIVRK